MLPVYRIPRVKVLQIANLLGYLLYNYLLRRNGLLVRNEILLFHEEKKDVFLLDLNCERKVYVLPGWNFRRRNFYLLLLCFENMAFFHHDLSRGSMAFFHHGLS